MTVTPERLSQMQNSWADLLGRLGVLPADAYPVFDRLALAYSEPHRHYHTLEHIHEMLRVVGRLNDRVSDPTSLRLAVWFHDAVYDPKSAENEADSAALALGELEGLGVAAVVRERVAEMIRATAHAGGVVGPDADTAILLDADLAILGSSEDRYRRYAMAIRREYDWVADEVFRPARARILEAFLERPRIYQTDLMFEAGEEAARRNLTREIESLIDPV